LPRGFDKATADPDIAVSGEAAGDANFTAAGDRVHYVVEVSGSSRYAVEVELRYQSIAYRWAHNLSRYNAPEPKRFVSYYEATAAGSSVVVARSGTTP
jgi:hypothetical protein